MTLITDKDPSSEHYIPAVESNPNRNPDGTFASSGGDQTGSNLDNHSGSDNTPAPKENTNKGHKVKNREKFTKYFDKQIEKVQPTVEEYEKNKTVDDLVHNALEEYTKDDENIKFIETAGSFAKGTDLAGSSDLDIFVGFDYDTDVNTIHEKSVEFGEKVLKPLCDEGRYTLQTGADGKPYGEGYINGIEVQIISVADVTMDQIKSGDMKTATDRSPHHTKFMKNALYGKENETRVLKRFFKDANVYGAESHNRGFSGYSTEVLMHNLGSFENVLGYFANFKKGSELGNVEKGRFDTHFVLEDPIDPNRNLGAAFSSTDDETTIMPDKNLGRLIKTARHFLATGEMPEITKENLDSITLSFSSNNLIKERHSQLQKYASVLVKRLASEGYNAIVREDEMDDDWSIDLPRIDTQFNEETGESMIAIALDSFEQDKEIIVRGPPTSIKPDLIDTWKEKHKDEDIFEKDGVFYYKSEKEFTEPFSVLKNILSKEQGTFADDFKNGFSVYQSKHDYENLTDQPKKKGEEGVDCGCTGKQFESFVAYQLDCVKVKAKEGQDYGLLLDKPQISGKQIKGTLAYAGVSLNNRLYLPEELAKGHGMTVPLIVNHASTGGAEQELHRLPEKFRRGLEDGLEMKVGEVTLTWDAEKLTLFYEGVVDDQFFQQEIDDMDMAVSLGMYYDSNSPKVCDVECYTMIQGAEFHEVSLVYHPGFPIATIEANEAVLKEASESVDKLAQDLLDAETKPKDLKDIKWS